jgi:hypothetical protein
MSVEALGWPKFCIHWSAPATAPVRARIWFRRLPQFSSQLRNAKDCSRHHRNEQIASMYRSMSHRERPVSARLGFQSPVSCWPLRRSEAECRGAKAMASECVSAFHPPQRGIVHVNDGRELRAETRRFPVKMRMFLIPV